MADNRMDDAEREAIREVLNNVSGLGSGEVDLIMELAMSQVRCRTALNGHGTELFTTEQAAHFVESMHAVAAADGEISEEEVAEIRIVAEELGFPQSA
ncbi:hypothetical protein A3709_05430 [Halioglobus sp. HI00S01]|uniref:TerB family tellurite resistance protein n=1 Tax=Halioglobus sp. HI00S01 TaxID=1822214 RepID=UPI0007C39046|nr:TerB family tellurite resistance protein [Halioglobus sp. HI00S01]KZX56540.1 hypothetical protein A3709_05430 [Halioglobus sp. HI00S01]